MKVPQAERCVADEPSPRVAGREGLSGVEACLRHAGKD
jgi:hypothetical protein